MKRRQAKLAAFMSHYDGIEGKLTAFCFTITGNESDAEDAAQDALCTAWEKFEQLADPNCAKGWLFSIAKNAAIDISKKRGREYPEANLPDPRQCPSAEDEVLEADFRLKIHAEIRKLPRHQAEAADLCIVRGYKPSEAGMLLGESGHVVSARLYRAARSLRKICDSVK